MDHKTLVDILSKQLNISRDSVVGLIDSLTVVMGECGSEQDTIVIPTFGSFEPRKRSERVALHPSTGKRLLVPPKINLVFKPNVALKQRIRNGK